MNDSGRYQTGRDFWEAAIVMTPAAQKLRSAHSITSPYENHEVEVSILLVSRNSETTIIDTMNTIVEAMGVVGKSFEIIVSDDHSSDRTVEMVRGYMVEFSNLRIVLRINHHKKGVYANYLDGAFIGCGKYYRLCYGDNSEPVETMVDVLRALGEADIVVPYYVSMHRPTLWERFTTRGFSWGVNMLTGNRINFYNGLHVHLRFNVMRWRAATAGAYFQTDLLCQLLDVGFTCKQVPCRAVPLRTHGGWKMTVRNLLSGAHTLAELLIRRVSGAMHKGGE